MLVLEPSCATVFRDELRGLFPENKLANKLREQTFVLSEFLEKKAPEFQQPRIARKAVVQGHCHHKSVLKFDDEKKLLEKMGVDANILTSGCCGMAGSFGYESGDHYDVSQACGERVILPKVREFSQSTLVIADGFSCRHQIEEGTRRKPLHLAQVLRMAQ